MKWKVNISQYKRNLFIFIYNDFQSRNFHSVNIATIEEFISLFYEKEWMVYNKFISIAVTLSGVLDHISLASASRIVWSHDLWLSTLKDYAFELRCMSVHNTNQWQIVNLILNNSLCYIQTAKTKDVSNLSKTIPILLMW